MICIQSLKFKCLQNLLKTRNIYDQNDPGINNNIVVLEKYRS